MEYVVVGRPFGLLGMAREGRLQWLQIQEAESMRDLSAALADFGYPEADARAAHNGTAAPVREIRQQLRVQDNRQLVATDVLSDEPLVYCAFIDLPVGAVTSKEYGVDDIRSPEELMQCLLPAMCMSPATA